MTDESSDIAVRKLSMLAKLTRLEEFAFFMEECVKAARDQADEKLNDPKISDAERTNALHAKLALNLVLDWPAQQIAMFERFIASK